VALRKCAGGRANVPTDSRRITTLPAVQLRRNTAAHARPLESIPRKLESPGRRAARSRPVNVTSDASIARAVDQEHAGDPSRFRLCLCPVDRIIAATGRATPFRRVSRRRLTASAQAISFRGLWPESTPSTGCANGFHFAGSGAQATVDNATAIFDVIENNVKVPSKQWKTVPCLESVF